MSKLNSLWMYLTDKKQREKRILEAKSKRMTDEEYLRKAFKIFNGRELNLENPQTYSEKIQWLKLYDRQPKYTVMQDKYAVREYVKEKIGEEYLIPLLGAWDKADDIDFDRLPKQFVLKCNHDCASVTICRDKGKFDKEKAREKLRKCLQRDYYLSGREWAYKNIKRKVIAEKYMEQKDGTDLTDYKFFCFSGKAKMLYVSSGQAHTQEYSVDFFNIDFEHLPIKRGEMASSQRKVTKPDGFEKLIPLVEKLAENIPFVRVDFYLIDGHPYFGEFAFYPSSGFSDFNPFEWEKKIGDWIKLPTKKTVETDSHFSL